MKICLIMEFFHPENSGGSPTMLSELMRFLRDRYADVEIEVITSRNLYRTPGGKLPSFEDWDGIHIHRVNTPRSNHPSTSLRLLYGCLFTGRALFSARKIIKSCDLILIGTNPPSSPEVARLFRRWRGIPYCYLIHDLYPDIAVGLDALPENSPVVALSRRVQKKWLRDAQSIVVLGRCMRRHLVNTYGVPPEKVRVITNWGDADKIRPMDRDTPFRKEHGLRGFLVIYAGNLGLAQGLDTVLDAAKTLQAEGREVTFLLVGDGNARVHLEERAREEHILNLRFLDAVPPPRYPEILGSSDVALVPLATKVEMLAVPSKAYSILAAGRPMIALMGKESEVGNMVGEHRCGAQVAQGDTRGLANAVRFLLDHPEELKRMGENARRTLLEHYTLEKAAEHFHALFQSLTGGEISGKETCFPAGDTMDGYPFPNRPFDNKCVHTPDRRVEAGLHNAESGTGRDGVSVGDVPGSKGFSEETFSNER